MGATVLEIPGGGGRSLVKGVGTKRLGKRRVNVMGHAYAKFAPLDFIGKKKMTGKRGKPNIPFSNLELNTRLPAKKM